MSNGENIMRTIPEAFSDESESYITLPALKKFAREKRKEDLKTTVSRPEIIADINSYADLSETNREQVREWLDLVLREGIKDVYVKGLDLDAEQLKTLHDEEYIKGKLDGLLSNPDCTHLNNVYSEELQYFRYNVFNHEEYGVVISFYLGKLIDIYDKKSGAQSCPYPIFVDIYVDKGIILGRAKPKSGMYKYMKDFLLDAAYTTNAEKEILSAIKNVLSVFEIGTKKARDVYDIFRGMLYRLLDKYAETPKEILQLMAEKVNEANVVKQLFMKDICNLSPSYETDVMSDIDNMIEKYFSISYPDKSIFTADRIGYPLKIMATDDEESKLEQTAANETPLQSKAVFFDNKKLLQKSQMCDGVWFRFQRLSPIYSGKAFNVRFAIKKDYCYLKFTEYTMEEDIVNVLFSFINA